MRIAISGLTGCGNSTASTLVSEALGLKKFNYTFHNLADDLGIPFPRLHELAEKNPKYDFILDRKQIEFALEHEDCVIGSRLAVFLPLIAPKLKMKKPSFDLKVWLDAPLQTRAQRLGDRDCKGFNDALDEVIYRDSSNKARYKKLYSLDYKKPAGCLAINNEKLNAEKTAQAIIKAAKAKRKKH